MHTVTHPIIDWTSDLNLVCSFDFNAHERANRAVCEARSLEVVTAQSLDYGTYKSPEVTGIATPCIGIYRR